VIGVRAAGSDGERRGAEYIAQQLESFGYDVEFQKFPIPIYEGVTTKLEVLGGDVYTSNAANFSASASAAAELVAVPGIGEPTDFPSQTAGRIALIERGSILLREKAANAEAAGAVGVIIYNNAPGNFTASGGPVVDIPTVTVSQEHGQVLRSLAASSAVQVSLSVEAVVNEGESLNVVARMPDSGQCQVVVGGHIDSVPAGPGANDNASGTAVALELARTLAAQDKTDGVCFAFFGAEEAGLQGSFHYVRQKSAEELDAMLGMLNFDMLAVGEQWPMVGSSALVSLAIEKADEIGVNAFPGDPPEGVGSDHAPFIQAGVPSILFNCFCDANYHTAADRAEFVKAERLDIAGEIGLRMVEDLLGG